MPPKRRNDAAQERRKAKAQKGGVTRDAIILEKDRVADMVHLRPLSKSTLRIHEYALQGVVFYLNEIEAGAGDAFLTNKVVPDDILGVAWLKAMTYTFASLLEPSSRSINKRPSVASVLTYAKAATSAIVRHLDGKIRPPVGAFAEVTAYVQDDLRKEFNLTTATLPKFTCKPADFERIICTLYTSDLSFWCERERVQMHFVLLLLAYGALRPGEISIGGVYREDNEGIKFKDVKIFLVADENGAVTIQALITARNLKGFKDDDSKEKGTRLYQETEDAVLLCMDATIPLVVLCLLDQAFADPKIQSPEDLYNADGKMIRDKFGGSVLVPFADGVLNTIICRQCSRSGVDANAGHLYARLAYKFSALGVLAGFVEPVALYSI
ncbi:hypothetical protein HDU89_007543 [Geranomyces variabilis]|nr:hypothetical protein HDU89_007543 [Geranomyces variabilis]